MFCFKCGAENPDGANYCRTCGIMMNASGSKAADIAGDPALRLILPVGRSGLAIAAGYVGLFSVLGIPGPFAILLGILALRDIRRNPSKMGKGRAIFGIVMGVIGTALVIAVLISAILGRSSPAV